MNKKDELPVAKFTVEQLCSSKKYKHRQDVLRVVLQSGQTFTLKEVDDRIDKFMKGKVK